MSKTRQPVTRLGWCLPHDDNHERCPGITLGGLKCGCPCHKGGAR